MRQRRLKNEINVVPYIDVMLVLLVIFMVATPMMTTGSVDLPSAGATSGKPDKFLKVQVEEDGTLSVFDTNGKQTKVKNSKELQTVLLPLKGDNDKMPVLIAGDKETQYKNIMNVLEEVKKMRFERIGLETGSK